MPFKNEGASGNSGGIYNLISNFPSLQKQHSLVDLWNNVSGGGGSPDPDLASLLLGQAGMPSNDGPKGGFKKNPMGAFPKPQATGNAWQEILKGASQSIAKNLKGAAENVSNPKRAHIAKNRVRQAGSDLTDYLEDYLAQKMATQGGEFDYESALRESEDAIRQAYKRDIHAVQRSSKSARRQTAKDRKDLEGMYNALARSYNKEGKQSIAQGQQLADMMGSISQEAAGNVQKSASEIANEQASLADQLGFEKQPEYMTDSAEQAQTDVASLLESGVDQANTQMGFAGNNQRYMTRGKQNAKLEGANRSADLLGDLQNYLQGNKDKVSTLRSARGREIAGNKNDVMSSITEMQAASDKQLFDQLMDFADLKQGIEQDQFDNDLSVKELRNKIKSGNRDSKQWAQEFALKQYEAQQDALSNDSDEQDSFIPGYMQDYTAALNTMNPAVRGLMNSIVKGPNFATGKFETDAGRFDLTPTAAANQAEKAARAQGIKDPKTIAKIRLAAQIYAEGGS